MISETIQTSDQLFDILRKYADTSFDWYTLYANEYPSIAENCIDSQSQLIFLGKIESEHCKPFRLEVGIAFMEASGIIPQNMLAPLESIIGFMDAQDSTFIKLHFLKADITVRMQLTKFAYLLWNWHGSPTKYKPATYDDGEIVSGNLVLIVGSSKLDLFDV